MKSETQFSQVGSLANVRDWGNMNAATKKYEDLIQRRLRYLISVQNAINSKATFLITDLKLADHINPSFFQLCAFYKIYYNTGSDSDPVWKWNWETPDLILVRNLFEEEKKWACLDIEHRCNLLGKKPRKVHKTTRAAYGSKSISNDVNLSIKNDSSDTLNIIENAQTKINETFQNQKPQAIFSKSYSNNDIKIQTINECFNIIKLLINKCFDK